MLRTSPHSKPSPAVGIAGQAKFCTTSVRPLTFELNLISPKVMKPTEMLLPGTPRFGPTSTYSAPRPPPRVSAWGTPTGTPRSTQKTPAAIPNIKRPMANTRPPSTRLVESEKSGGSIIVLRPLTATPSPLAHDHTSPQPLRAQPPLPTPRAHPEGSNESRAPEPPTQDRAAAPSPRVNLDRSRAPPSPVSTPTYEERVMQWRREMFCSYQVVQTPHGSEVGAPSA